MTFKLDFFLGHRNVAENFPESLFSSTVTEVIQADTNLKTLALETRSALQQFHTVTLQTDYERCVCV